jgi:aryl carrier-like protein
MVLKDATFEKMTLDDWKTSVSPKVEGSWNLHSCLPMDLDFFVFLSSVSGITGLGGQTNYAAGNTYIDALAKHRLACGQPASTLNLGWMASEGVVAGNDFLEKQLRRIGYFIPISTDQFHTLLELHCAKTGDNKAVRETAQNIIGLETPLRMARKGAEIPAWMSRKIFCHLKETSEPHSSTGLSTGSQTLTEELLSSAETLSECAKLVSLALAQKVATLIEISEGDIDIKKSLHDYGVDSLFAIEIKSWAKKVCHTDIAVMEMMSKDSIYGVGEFIASKSPLCSHHLS